MATAKKKAARKPRVPIDPNETKAQRFARLASARVSKAVRTIYNIGNLGGSGYESTAEQREKIVAALTAAVENVLGRLNKETGKPASFTL